MITLSDDSKLSCVSVINRGLTGISFELPPEVQNYLLREYNLKIQKVSAGYICFFGHRVGEGKEARSSGEALCLFLRSRGCTLDPQNITDSLEKFCRLQFT